MSFGIYKNSQEKESWKSHFREKLSAIIQLTRKWTPKTHSPSFNGTGNDIKPNWHLLFGSIQNFPQKSTRTIECGQSIVCSAIDPLCSSSRGDICLHCKGKSTIPRQIWVLWDTEKFFVSYYKYNIRGNSASIECKGEKTENIKSEKLEGGVTDALLKKHENNSTATRTEQTDLR